MNKKLWSANFAQFLSVFAAQRTWTRHKGILQITVSPYFLVKSNCTYGVLTVNLCVAHQHCILCEFHVSIITITAQAPQNSNIPRRSKVQPQFLQRLFKELIHLSFFHAWLTVPPLWQRKSIYLYHVDVLNGHECVQLDKITTWRTEVQQTLS